VTRVIIGWIVRTETSGRHRYWKVGEADPDRAAQIACDAVNAEVARAVTGLPALVVVPKFQIAPGIFTEIVWETKHVAGPFRLPVLEGQTDGSGAKGEVTFDIVVPEDGVTFVEGCYRINGGNWEVYFFRKENRWSGAPRIRRNAVFSSGITGLDGVVPDNWVLNKRTVMGMLAVALGVEEWTEVVGLDSLILK
jgi:hypothetical protein